MPFPVSHLNLFNPIVVFIWRLWRIYKRIYHLLTGKCELQRICSKYSSINDRTVNIVKALKVSKYKNLRNITDYIYYNDQNDENIQPENVLLTILKAKNLMGDKDPKFVSLLRPCILPIVALNVLKCDIVKLQSEQYAYTTEQEQLLIKLWAILVPQTELIDRYGKHWGDIGFQGNDPATDFRGMGMLGLHCLVYFGEMHTGKARQVLTHSQHPTKGYPLAITSINITSIVYDLIMYGRLDYYFYNLPADRIPTLNEFMEIYCYVMYAFDEYWLESNPANIMEFPHVKNRFLHLLNAKLNERPLTTDFSLN